MKLLNSSIAVLLLSLATLSSVSEAKLAPTTFVGKSKASFPSEASLTEVLGEPEQKQTHSKTSSKSKSTTLSSLTRLAGGSAESLSPAFTYYLDIFLTVLVGGFTAIWFVSMRNYNLHPNPEYLGDFPNFDINVLDQGFCLVQEPSKTLFGLGTEKLCGIADLLLVVFSYFKYKDSFVEEGDLKIGGGQITSEMFFGFALFTLLHGAIHFFAASEPGKIWGDDISLVESIVTVGLLAVLSIFSRLGLKAVFDQAGKIGWDAIATVGWLGLVAAFVIGINEKAFALTFINVSIFLPVLAARALLLKKDDERRLEGFYDGKTAMGPVIIAIIHLSVMFFEPLVCKAWFESVGGHIWFDISLWFMLLRNLF